MNRAGRTRLALLMPLSSVGRALGSEPSGPRFEPARGCHGAVAKWERCGLQNRHEPVRFRPAPPWNKNAKTEDYFSDLLQALVGQLDGQRISTPPHAGSSPAERAIFRSRSKLIVAQIL